MINIFTWKKWTGVNWRRSNISGNIDEISATGTLSGLHSYNSKNWNNHNVPQSNWKTYAMAQKEIIELLK